MLTPFRRLASVIGATLVALLAFAGVTEAGEAIHSIYLGVLAHDVPDLWSGFQVESDAADINFEVQFAPALSLLGGTIRPAVGGTVNTRGDTSHAYIDARWQYDCPSGIFFGIGLGAAVHDGEIGGKGADPDMKWLGSRVLFHIPAEIGMHLDEHQDVSVYFEHTSNANTQTYNEGMDRLGIRYGYRF